MLTEQCWAWVFLKELNPSSVHISYLRLIMLSVDRARRSQVLFEVVFIGSVYIFSGVDVFHVSNVSPLHVLSLVSDDLRLEFILVTLLHGEPSFLFKGINIP